MAFESFYTPDCLICERRMVRVPPSKLLADREQRNIYEAQAQRLHYDKQTVWHCAHCNVICPFEFVGKCAAQRPIIDETDDPNCPNCGFDLIRLGGCEHSSAFRKIYYCHFCIASARAIAIFGYTKPEHSEYFYFTRLTPDEVLDRLDDVENEDLLFSVSSRRVSPGQVHTALTAHRDAFRADPEQAFRAMRHEHLRTVRFIFAYAFNYKPEDVDAARKERVRDALEQHQYVGSECPCLHRFRHVELAPERTVLAWKANRKYVRPFGVVALIALVASIASGVPELIGFGVLVAICLGACIGAILTAYTQIVVEEGILKVEHRGIVPAGTNTQLIRITAIALGKYWQALEGRRVAAIPENVIESENDATKPIPQGLLFIDGDQKVFAAFKGSYSELLWMRQVILEAAKAQAIYTCAPKLRRTGRREKQPKTTNPNSK